jgi:predicted regulator of amino acid metabolism with ACT domain
MNKEQLIKEIKDITTHKTRENGEGYYIITEEHPRRKEILNELYTLGFEIQDFYYKTLEDAIYAIVYMLEQGHTPVDTDNELIEHIEADIYTQDLLRWLSEDINNLARCDEAMQEYDLKSVETAISYAQQDHKHEIYLIVWQMIQEVYKQELETIFND